MVFATSLVAAVKSKAKQFALLDDSGLQDEALRLGFESQTHRYFSRSLITSAFALVQIAAQRHLDMSHYNVQLLGGLAMVRGKVAEMQTGEGKTLTATLPLFVHALRRRGSWLATSNDYLAQRDADWMRPVFQTLGMSVGVIQSDMDPDQRRAAYRCDITYGTLSEFGFDFLRDHSNRRMQDTQRLWYENLDAQTSRFEPVQRPLEFLLIDEADSILIDDARTPLIISTTEDGPDELQQRELYRWSARYAPQFVEETDYWYDREKRSVDLTSSGTSRVRAVEKPATLRGVGLPQMYDFMERAIQVERDFKLDRDYVVRDGEIVIVDEATGRIAEGRRWSRGIHQAIEAKQGVESTQDTQTRAKITVQSFVNRFPSIAGMTGTASAARHEFNKIYKMGVAALPPNRRSRRQTLPFQFAKTEMEKFRKIIDETIQIHQTGRPVLIGTRSIAKSELLSKSFGELGIDHDVLNARQIEREAEIIANAGMKGRITVATNMAGRGTDIKIDDEVRELGGLHVIGSEIHESSRIDRQLFGRCGRQGDPGTVRQYFSAEDQLLETAFGRRQAEKIRGNACHRGASYWRRLFDQAQRMVERQHFRARRILMHQEKQLSESQREMGLDPILDNYGD